MSKEVKTIEQAVREINQPLRKIEERRNIVVRGMQRITDIYLSTPNRAGKIEAGNIDATIEVGRTKAAADKTIHLLEERLSGIDNESKPVVLESATHFLDAYRENREKLGEVAVLFSQGYITEDILNRHQEEFEELANLPENHPILKEAIERIKLDEEKSKEKSGTTVDLHDQEIGDLVLQTPHGKVTILNMKFIESIGDKMIGKLLRLYSERPLIDTNEIAKALYSSDSVTVSKRVSPLIRVLNGKLERDKIGVRIVNIAKKKTALGQWELQEFVEEPTQAPKKAPAENVKRSNIDSLMQNVPEVMRNLLTGIMNAEDFKFAKGVLIKEIAKIKAIGNNPEETRKLSASVAGFLFESLCYSFLRGLSDFKQGILLSPKQTFDVYALLNPHKDIIKDYDGLQLGLDGISVPDGIVLSYSPQYKRLIILGICEYKLAINGSFHQLPEALSTLKNNSLLLTSENNPEVKDAISYIRNNYPNLSTDIKGLGIGTNIELYFARPSSVNTPQSSEIKPIQIPISSIVFGKFISALMADSQK